MTTIDIKNSNLITLDYEHLSIDLREIWEEYKDVEDKVKSVIVQMVTVLENNGFSRTEAIEKIYEDHKDLKGFSRPVIYRQLPKRLSLTIHLYPEKLSSTEMSQMRHL